MKNLSKLFFLIALLLAGTAKAVIIPSLPYNLTNGSVADATQVMGNYNTIVTDVNANAAHNGVNTDILSLTGLTTPLGLQYGGTPVYEGGTATLLASAYTTGVTNPIGFGLTTGNMVIFTASGTNTGPATLQVYLTSAAPLVKLNNASTIALAPKDIITTGVYVAIWNGSQYELTNPSTAVSGPTAATDSDIALMSGGTGNIIRDSGILMASVAPLNSPAFTGTPTAPTAATSVTNTQIATTAYVSAATRTPLGIGSIVQAGYQSGISAGALVSGGNLAIVYGGVVGGGFNFRAGGLDSLSGDWQALQTLPAAGGGTTGITGLFQRID